jgi:methylenetetrahydrofolate reductase (NADPH)
MSTRAAVLSPAGGNTMASANARLASLLKAATLEVYSRNAPAQLSGGLAPGSDVYVSYLPGDDAAKRVEIAAELRKAGYNPVLHVPARQMLDHATLDDYVARAAGEAGATRFLLIAGDSTRPRGPFANSLAVLQSGALQKRGVRFVDVAGHPEGNAGLDASELTAILVAKRDAARAAGLEMGVVTQFCFDPRPIADWLAAARAAKLGCPIRIGLAGPANPATLMKFAMRCGIGNSIMALQKHVGTLGRLLRDTGPDGVARGLAEALDGPDGADVTNFHFFPFGGLTKTLGWIKTAIAEAEA